MTVEPLIGRDVPLAAADAAIAGAARGTGGLVLISGDPGIGKSRLVQEIVRRAMARGMTRAYGYAVDDPGAPPLWPWRRALRELPTVLAALDDAAIKADVGARFTMFVTVADRLSIAAGTRGIVLALEDMHWADRLSILLLTHLCTELPDSRVAVVISYRPDHQGPLRDGIDRLIRGSSVTHIALDGLTIPDVQTWLRDVPGLEHRPALAVQLRERTAGNPLLIRLLAEALVSSPAEADSRSVERMLAQRPDLRRLVTARADMLSAPARKILQAASVLGERVAPLELAAVTDLTSAAIGGLLEEAVGAGILRAAPDAPGLAFTHALVRDAVYADLTASARSHWHRRSAVALETIEGSAAAGRIAMHWHQATGPDAADHCSRWASLAAEQARNALAFDEAAQFAAMATERAQLAGDDGRLAELTLELAHAQFANTAIEESLSSCVDAAELAERAGRPDLVAAAGLVVHGIGAPDINRTIGRLCQRALRHPGLTDQTVRARLLAQLAVAEAVNGGGPSAADLAAKALTAAEETGDPDAVLEAIAARHLAISTPSSVVERLELGRRAVELGGASKQPIAAVWGHLWRVDAAFQLGNLAEVERELAEIDRIARTRRSGLARWHHHRLIATRSALLGDFAEARAHTIAARDLAERMGDASLTGMFYAFCSELAHTRGDPTELPANWLELNPSTPDIPLIQLAKCSWQLLIGRRDEARAEFEQFRGLPTTMPVGVRWAPTLGLIASIAVELRDSTVAEQVFELLAPTAVYYGGDGSGVAFSHGSNARVVADVALVAGRRDDALRYYVDAVDMNARIGARPFTALSRLGWARALLTPPASAGLGSPPGQHDLRLARELADQAAAEFRRLDMPGPLAAASALLTDLDVLGRNPNPLTVRESEIVTLIAAAMSNKDIAARLFLSERTVETHVRHILGKLGFASRTEIATWAVLHQP